MKRYAILSDIHGNLRALQAVLNDMEKRHIDTIVNLGDHLFGALEAEQTAQTIRQTPMLCIYGNTDREILESLNVVAKKDQMERVKAQLSADTIQWLRSLPKTRDVDGVLLACHGTPDDDNTYLLEMVTPHGVFVYSDEHLVAATINVRQKVILCGHSHVNRVIYLSNGKVILNPGSVGLPAYLGNGEFRFAMESMTPHAKYAIVEVADDESIGIEQVHVPYDWHAASAAAMANGSQNWADFLLHGRMPKALQW